MIDKFTVRRFLQYVDESSLRPSDRIGNEGVLLLNLCAV